MNQEAPKSTHILTLAIVLSLFFGIIGGASGSQIVAYFINNPSRQVFASESQKIVENKTYIEESQSIDAIKKVSPAVVSIVATQDLKVYYKKPYFFYEPFHGGESFEDVPSSQFKTPRRAPDRPESAQEKTKQKDYEITRQRVSGGSGFIINSDGLVLTNRHVVDQEDVDYTIIMNDGTEYDGEVLSIDPLNDLAFLQMVKKGELDTSKQQRTQLHNLPIIEFGNSKDLEVGQKVLAIGYALGQYQNTVTSGIISGKSRSIVAGGGLQAPEQLTGLLQTDTAINPGNSGGPLINLAGQVVGVNVAIDVTGNGIGFAIPIDDVKPVIDSVKKYGRIVRPTLGVRHIMLTKAQTAELKINVDHGALLVGDQDEDESAVVPGSPADKAGLKTNDVISAVDGQEINLDHSLQDAIRSHQPGNEITLTVWRDGQTLTLKAKLAEMKEERKQESGIKN